MACGNDRAVFHFLTTPDQQMTYRDQLSGSLKDGGNLIIGTFAFRGATQMQWATSAKIQSRTIGSNAGRGFSTDPAPEKTAHHTSGRGADVSLLSFPKTAGRDQTTNHVPVEELAES